MGGGFDYSIFLSFFFSPFPVLLSSRAADLPGSMSGRESVAVSFDAVQPKYAVLFLKTLSIRLSEARMSLLIFGSRCNFFFLGRGEILHILALSVVHVHPDQSHIWGVVCPFCARNKVLLMLNKGRTWTSCRYADKHLLSWKCADVCGGSSSTGWWNYCHRFRKPAAARQASSEHKVHFFDSFPKAWPGRDKTIRKVSVSSPCNCRFLSAGPETPQPPSPSSVCSYPLLTSPLPAPHPQTLPVYQEVSAGSGGSKATVQPQPSRSKEPW